MNYLSKISDKFAEDANVRFMVLYGSLARNEQIFYEYEGKRNLINDADFLLVVRDHEQFLKDEPRYRDVLGEIFGTNKIDFVIRQDGNVFSKKNTIWYYDLINANQVLLGDKDEFLSILQQITQQDISKYDLFSMYLTRSWALCYAFIYHENSKLVNYQYVKAGLAALDFRLLSNGCYTPFISKKRKIVDGCHQFKSEEKHFYEQIFSIREELAIFEWGSESSRSSSVHKLIMLYCSNFSALLGKSRYNVPLIFIYILKYFVIGLISSVFALSMKPVLYRLNMLQIGWCVRKLYKEKKISSEKLKILLRNTS